MNNRACITICITVLQLPTKRKIPVGLSFLHHRHKAWNEPFGVTRVTCLRSWLAYLPTVVLRIWSDFPTGFSFEPQSASQSTYSGFSLRKLWLLMVSGIRWCMQKILPEDQFSGCKTCHGGRIGSCRSLATILSVPDLGLSLHLHIWKHYVIVILPSLEYALQSTSYLAILASSAFSNGLPVSCALFRKAYESEAISHHRRHRKVCAHLGIRLGSVIVNYILQRW